jgi:FKBP-type peptidyl-prolyl cis-trans isomerase 2
MQAVKNGDTVRVHYHGRLTDGTTFDSSEGRDPLEFQVGAGSVIKGFDKGVLDMKVGDKKTVHIPADEAYGPADERNVVQYPMAQVPPDMKLEIGMQLQMHDNSGRAFNVTVIGIDSENVTLDANPPLAGKDLIFDIELVEIK